MRGTAFHRAAVALLVLLIPSFDAHGLKMMPMGDSITKGFHEPGGSYRKVMALADPSIDFVGEFSTGAGQGFDADHQGVSGHTIQEMIADYGPAVATYNPEVVLLLAGTNNHGIGATTQDYLDLFALIGPRRIIAATVPKFGYDKPGVAYWTDAWVDNRNNVVIPAINDALTEAVSITPDASLVDYYALLDPATDLVVDAVHPNAMGQAKLADLFTAELHRAPGDLDGDGDIDGVDVSTAFARFTGPGPAGMLPIDGNLDGDGDVDGVDLSVIFTAFTGPSAAAHVPEPSAPWLLLTLGACCIRRRGNRGAGRAGMPGDV